MVHPRRNVPVNRAHFVSRLVFADFLEIHPLALKNAVVLAGERFRHQPIRADLDLPDFFKDLSGNHCEEVSKPAGRSLLVLTKVGESKGIRPGAGFGPGGATGFARDPSSIIFLCADSYGTGSSSKIF